MTDNRDMAGLTALSSRLASSAGNNDPAGPVTSHRSGTTRLSPIGRLGKSLTMTCVDASGRLGAPQASRKPVHL